MTARDNILARIRKAQGRAGAQPTEAEIAQARSVMAEHARGPQPSIARPADPVAHFLAECDRLSTTHVRVDSESQVPRQAALYLDANNLERKAVAWPELATLDWAGAGVRVEHRAARGDDTVGITGCFCAVAETGSLLLLGGRDTPRATALLPETHIAVVRASRLVSSLEDAFARLREEVGEPPRATWFVSGPSRTADIEQTMVIGAHGPYRVHVILIT